MNLKDYQERKTNPCHRWQRFQRFPEFFRFKIMEEKGKLVALLSCGLLCDSQSVRVFHKDRGESTLHHDVLSSLRKAIGAQLLSIHALLPYSFSQSAWKECWLSRRMLLRRKIQQLLFAVETLCYYQDLLAMRLRMSIDPLSSLFFIIFDSNFFYRVLLL